MTGQKWIINHYVPTSQAITYDADGDRTKEVLDTTTTYYIKSTVLDEEVEEVNSSGQKTVGYVRYPAGVSQPASEGYRMQVAKRVFAHIPDGCLTMAGKLLYRHIG